MVLSREVMHAGDEEWRQGSRLILGGQVCNLHCKDLVLELDLASGRECCTCICRETLEQSVQHGAERCHPRPCSPPSRWLCSVAATRRCRTGRVRCEGAACGTACAGARQVATGAKLAATYVLFREMAHPASFPPIHCSALRSPPQRWRRASSMCALACFARRTWCAATMSSLRRYSSN